MEEQQVCGLIGASIYIYEIKAMTAGWISSYGVLGCRVECPPDSDMWRKEHENSYVETAFLTISTTHSASAAQTVQ